MEYLQTYDNIVLKVLNKLIFNQIQVKFTKKLLRLECD